MQAIQVHQAGDASVLQLADIATPTCGETECLVEMKVAGVNFVDIYFRNGLYKPPRYPYTPGTEGSGRVVEVGNQVKDIKVGDRVAACVSGSGTYAQYTVFPADKLAKIPDGISDEEAGASLLQGLTAYYLTHLTYPLRAGETALIHAGAGGTGLLLIQMAKAIGASVITTVSSEEKKALAESMGADHVILYTQESFLQRTLAMTENTGVNVVYDSIGKTTFNDSLKSLTFRGMLVSFGNASGAVGEFSMSQLAEKSLFVTRPTLWNYIRHKHELDELSAGLFQLVKDKKLKITINQRYSLANAAKAHRDLENRSTVGKSIIVL